MDKTSPKTLQNWAVFRFSVIGGLLARPPEKGELQKELGLLAEQLHHMHPDLAGIHYEDGLLLAR